MLRDRCFVLQIYMCLSLVPVAHKTIGYTMAPSQALKREHSYVVAR